MSAMVHPIPVRLHGRGMKMQTSRMEEVHLVQGKKKQVVVSKRENRAWVTVHLCSMEVSL